MTILNDKYYILRKMCFSKYEYACLYYELYLRGDEIRFYLLLCSNYSAIVNGYTNSMTYGTRRFNATFQGLSKNPYPEPNQPNYPH